MFHKNPQHPALLCELDLKQNCVRAKRPPRNFQHFDLSPLLFGKIAALPFTDVRRQCALSGHALPPQIVEQPQRRGRTKNSWGPKVYKLATDVVLGADLDEAPTEHLCAMPMCH